MRHGSDAAKTARQTQLVAVPQPVDSCTAQNTTAVQLDRQATDHFQPMSSSRLASGHGLVCKLSGQACPVDPLATSWHASDYHCQALPACMPLADGIEHCCCTVLQHAFCAAWSRCQPNHSTVSSNMHVRTAPRPTHYTALPHSSCRNIHHGIVFPALLAEAGSADFTQLASAVDEPAQ
jgi:hypothetical protein